MLNIDGLEIGEYEFRLIVTDYQCRTTEDYVIVTVVNSLGETSNTATSTLPTMSSIVLVTTISAISVIGIGSFLISIYRKKHTPQAG